MSPFRNFESNVKYSQNYVLGNPSIRKQASNLQAPCPSGPFLPSPPCPSGPRKLCQFPAWASQVGFGMGFIFKISFHNSLLKILVLKLIESPFYLVIILPNEFSLKICAADVRDLKFVWYVLRKIPRPTFINSPNFSHFCAPQKHEIPFPRCQQATFEIWINFE